MKKIIKAFLFYDIEQNNYCLWDFKPYTADGARIMLDEKEVEFDIPDDFDPRPAQIKALKEKQTKAAAAFHAMNVEFARQINELQAMEMTV